MYFILEKVVNHGEHSERGEKTRAYVPISNHLLGDCKEVAKAQVSRRARRVAAVCSAVSAFMACSTSW